MKNALKRILSILLAITIIFSSAYVGVGEIDFSRIFAVRAIAASSGTTGACTWTLDGTALTISGNGAMEDYVSSSELPWETNITEVVIENGVTSIGDSAFNYCTNLTSITIPDSVTSIGDFSFANCYNLTSITLPDTITEIGDCAFSSTGYCDDINNFENDVLYIGKHLIGAKTSLSGEYEINPGTKTIGTGAFGFCSLITSIVIPDSVISIGVRAFYECTSLTSITIPDSVTSIDEGAFHNCINLTHLTIPDSVTSIGDYGFNNCTSLTSITIPDSVTSIGSHAFRACSSLTSVVIPDGVTSIGDYAFYRCSDLKYVFYPSSENEWNGITFGINNELLTNAIIHYNATEHSYNAGVVTRKVTCEVDGIITFSCQYPGCTDSYIITIPSFGHKYISEITKQPTCEDDGILRYTCQNEGCYSVYTEAIPATDHAMDDGTVTLAATCTTDGVMTYKCQHTNCYYKVTLDIPATGHNYLDEWTIDLAPTCTENGSKSHHCLHCDEKNEVTTIVALGHNYNCVNISEVHPHIKTFVCEVCSDVITGANTVSDCVECNFALEKTVDNTYKVLNYIGNEKDVVIPREFNGCLVTSIGGGAFNGCESITSISIPDSVTSIGNYAFSDCTSLTSITIPDSVTSIGGRAFKGCTNLNNVYISDVSAWCSIVFEIASSTEINMTTYYYESNPLYYADNLYLNGVLVTDLVIPEGITTISATAFYGYKYLTSITIPDSVTSIGQYAFYGCSELASVKIGSGVKSIGGRAFNGCTKLDNVYISDISAWCSIKFEVVSYRVAPNSNIYYDYTSYPFEYARNLYLNGVLVTDLTIPEGVTSVDMHRFRGCGSITSITIPDSVTRIGSRAFSGCTSLTNITIGSGVKNIDDRAFNGCINLENVYISDVSAWCSIAYSTGYIDSGIGTIIRDDFTSLPFYYAENLYLNNVLVADLVIPEGVTSISPYAFYGCGNFDSVTIPSTVTSIGESAFFGCTISKVIVECNSYAASYLIADKSNYVVNHSYDISGDKDVHPHIITYTCSNCNDVVTESDTFSDCVECNFTFEKKTDNTYKILNYTGNEKDVVIPSVFNGCLVTSIDECAFMNSDIESITIPDTIREIGYYAFYGCNNLEAVYIEDLSKWCQISFSYEASNPLMYADNLYLNGELVTDLVIPDDVTSISPYAFYYHNSFNSVKIPNNVTSIGEKAFFGCTKSEFVVECASYAVSYVEDNGLNYFVNHSSREWITHKEQTCTDDGIKSFDCLRCGDETNVTVVEALGHNFGEWQEISKLSCTEDGVEVRVCSNCNKEETKFAAKLGHDFSTEWTIDVEATCTENGSKSHHCSRCDVKSDVTEIIAIGHLYEATNILTVHPHTITHTCSICSGTIIEKSKHQNCLECQFTITAIDLSSYKLILYIGTETDVVIPTEYNGYKITTIANSCFKNNKNITSVKIPEGVTSIGSLAFMNCTSLEKVYIPTSVTSIGQQAFYGFTGTIYCEKDSFVHEYAVANNIDYVLLSISETETTRIDYDNFLIYTSVQSCADILDILDVSENAIAIPTASYVYGNLELYGTGTIVTVFDGDDYIGDFTLIVEGDTNGDSVCNVLDVFDAERASSGHIELEGAFAMAADSNSDDTIDINDYQAIVNKALAS